MGADTWDFKCTDRIKLSFSLNSCCNPLNNYMVFNDTDGLYTYTFEAERKVT